MNDLTTMLNPATMTVTELLKAVRGYEERNKLYMFKLHIYEEGSGRTTAYTSDGSYKEYFVFRFHNLKDLVEKLNE